MSKEVYLKGNFTKEQLEKEIEKLTKPNWDVIKNSVGDICLYKNGKHETIIWLSGTDYLSNLSQLPYELTKAFGYLANESQILQRISHPVDVYITTTHKPIIKSYIVDTESHADEITKFILLNKIIQNKLKRIN